MVLGGPFDLSESHNFKSNFEQLINTDFKSVSVDMSFVEYIDSSGVASILFIKKTCDRLNINFAIEAISYSAFRVLELAKLNIVLNIKSSALVQDSVQANSNASIELDRFDTTTIFGKDASLK